MSSQYDWMTFGVKARLKRNNNGYRKGDVVIVGGPANTDGTVDVAYINDAHNPYGKRGQVAADSIEKVEE